MKVNVIGPKAGNAYVQAAQYSVTSFHPMVADLYVKAAFCQQKYSLKGQYWNCRCDYVMNSFFEILTLSRSFIFSQHCVDDVQRRRKIFKCR